MPLLLLSATIGNAKEIADWLSAIRRKPCRLIQETQRPVPLYPLYFAPPGRCCRWSRPPPKGKSRFTKK
jgi:ATP-dependent RNA helicase HelY